MPARPSPHPARRHDAAERALPAFRSHGGQFLVSFDAYKRHYSLFPASGAVVEALGAEIEPYLSGKGTIRFPATEPHSRRRS